MLVFYKIKTLLFYYCILIFVNFSVCTVIVYTFHWVGIYYELFKMPLQSERNGPINTGNSDCRGRGLKMCYLYNFQKQMENFFNM